MVFVGTLGSLSTNRALFGQWVNTANWLRFNVYASGGYAYSSRLGFYRRLAASSTFAYGSTALQEATRYLLAWGMDGSGPFMQVNGSRESLTWLAGSQSNVEWWDDLHAEGTDYWYLACQRNAALPELPFNGSAELFAIHPSAGLSQSQLAGIWQLAQTGA